MYRKNEATTPPLLYQARPEVIVDDLRSLERALLCRSANDLGYPGARDFDHAELADLLTKHLLNNIGDPFEDGQVTHHTKHIERQVLEAIAWLFRSPPGWWGYVANGSSEGTLYALRAARSACPGSIIFHSTAAHYSVAKAADLLAMATCAVQADHRGEMDYQDLALKLKSRRERPPIIVATIGTTMTEAVDDLHRINAICDQLQIRQRFVHADAAMAGLPLALLPPDRRPGFDLADGADTIVTSGHKFLSTLMPCAVVIVKRRKVAPDLAVVDYIGGHDTTIAGSRSGHLPLLLWLVLRSHGLTGLRTRAITARDTAAYAVKRLTSIGWDAWKHQHAFTVVLRTPPPEVVERWPLPSSAGWSHLITMPGISRSKIDQFVEDLEHAGRVRVPAHQERRAVPRTAAHPSVL